VSEIFTILNRVRAGLGVSLVPSSAEPMGVPELRFHQLDPNEATWLIGVTWRRASERNKLISRFVEAIRTVAAGGAQEHPKRR
jgi:DNA-binding transcriptional LysR family regulator